MTSSKCRLVAAMAAAALAAPVLGDDLIQQGNHQESLGLGIVPMHQSEQTNDRQSGAPFENEAYGDAVRFAYDKVRARDLFGLHGIYTRLSVSLDVADLRYTGNSIDPASGSIGAVDEHLSYIGESVDWRMGRSWELGEPGRYALTPYVDLGQRAWAREVSTGTKFFGYDHESVGAGLLGQVSLGRRILMGVDAGLGRTVGALQFGGIPSGRYWLNNATMAATTLSLDYRSSAKWHQRLEIGQSHLRYGQPATFSDVFEPRRQSQWTVMLEFGTELGLY